MRTRRGSKRARRCGSVGEPALDLLEPLGDDLAVVVIGRGDLAGVRPGELLGDQPVQRRERALAERAAVDEERRRGGDTDRAELALARRKPLLAVLSVPGELVAIEAERRGDRVEARDLVGLGLGLSAVGLPQV